MFSCPRPFFLLENYFQMSITSTRRSVRKASGSLNEKEKINKTGKNEEFKPPGSSNSSKLSSVSKAWSIEQETTLYKAICRFKPAGKHKHFRMLSIYQTVNNPSITSSVSPITMDDIWEKLSTLYDLEELDDLEDSSEFMAEEERLSENRLAVPYHGSLGGLLGDGTYLQDFYLPWDDFAPYIIEQALPQPGEISDESDYQDSDEESHIDQNFSNSNSFKKRGRSQSTESQPHTSEISEIENEGIVFQIIIFIPQEPQFFNTVYRK